MGSVYLRKYGTTLDASTAGSTKIRISLRKAGSATFAINTDWSPAAGDVKVSKDGGAQANIGTLPSYSNGQWEFILSDTELSAKSVAVVIIDAALDDEDFTVETFGHASAMYPTLYSSGTAGNPATVTDLSDYWSKRARAVDSQLTMQRVVASQAVSTSFYFWNDALTGARLNSYDYAWGVCYVNGTADGTVTVTVGGDAGAEPKRWTASATLPSGLSDGDIVEIEVKAGFEDGVNPVLRTIVWRGYVDASVSSRAPTSNWTAARAGYLDKLNTGVTLAASQHVITDSGTVTTLTNAPADSSGVTTLLGRVVGTLAAGTHVAQSGDSYAIANDATNGNAAIKTAVGTRMASADANVAAIKAQTDKLTFNAQNEVAASASVSLTDQDITDIATQVSASIDVTDDVAAAIAGVDNISVIGIVNGQHITLVRGDSYESTDARRKIAFTRVAGESWPTDLTGYTITFTARKSADNQNTGDASFTCSGTVTTPTGDSQVVTLATIASTATDSLAIGEGTKGYVWDLVATSSGGKEATLRMGVMTVKEDQTHA